MFRFSIVIVAMVSLVAGCERGEIVDTYSFSEEITNKITNLNADIDAANLIVEPTVDGTTTVEVDVEYWWREAEFEVWVDGSTLYVDLECHPSCKGEVVVYVPAEVSVDADNGSGKIEISDLDGTIRAHTGSGSVVVENAIGDLDLEAGSGSVKGRNLGASVAKADAGSGSIELTFIETPAEVRAEAGSGSVKLNVPAGSYNLDLHVGSGKTSTENIIDDPHARNSIRASAGSGNVSVRGH